MFVSWARREKDVIISVPQQLRCFCSKKISLCRVQVLLQYPTDTLIQLL